MRLVEFCGNPVWQTHCEGMEAVERGELILGGCFIMPGQPDWKCTAWGHQWFDADHPTRIRRDKILDDLINDNSRDSTEKALD